MTGGPLTGIRVLEFAGLGPGPFAGMMLAELGADVVRIDRPAQSGPELIAGPDDQLNRGKRSILLDLKDADDRGVALRLAEQAHALLEGGRPGVMERLGLGPDACLARNPRLVYGRMTGWGQTGPLRETAGHDINFIALSGALHSIGSPGGPPVVPLNLVGDFGGGATYLVAGVLAALLDAERTGSGQVIDAAIVDGAAHLMASTYSLMAAGRWGRGRGNNLLDGGAPFYGVYSTLDAEHMAVGAVENQFYAELLRGLELELDPGEQLTESCWPVHRAAITAAFAGRTRAAWEERFAGSDACVTPVLSPAEAAEHPHVRARGSLRRGDGPLRAGPAPRFSSTPQPPERAPSVPGADREQILADWLV